jgi:Cytochrome c7 and related cytochrome c
MNGNTQNVVFTNASTAQANAVTGVWTAGTYPNGTCSVYCHGVSMPKGDTGGTARTPSWTSNLMTGVPANDCALCHGNPPTTGTSAATHSGKAPTTSCNDCHDHFTTAGGFATEANRRLHIDGTLQAKGDCNSCHDYDVVGYTYAASTYTGGYWGKSSYDGLTPSEGAGAHASHINYIKTRLAYANTPLVVTNQTYGLAGSDNVRICGTCHTTNVNNHMAGTRIINFGDSTFVMGGSGGTSMLFGSTNPIYNGTPGTSKQTTPKTCSNLSCHYFTTPNW